MAETSFFDSALDVFGDFADTAGSLWDRYATGQAKIEQAKRTDESAIPGTQQDAGAVQRNADGTPVATFTNTQQQSILSAIPWWQWLLGLLVIVLVVVLLVKLL